MPDFALEKSYNDNEKLTDLIDDIFGKDSVEEGVDLLNDYDKKEKKKESSVTDAEAEKICNEWKEKYKVAIGVSWGELPYDLQQKWLEYSCDYHMTNSAVDLASSSLAPTISPTKIT